MARSRTAKPSELETWFVFVGDESPTLTENPVTTISRATGAFQYGPAREHDWSDVYAWFMGDGR